VPPVFHSPASLWPTLSSSCWGIASRNLASPAPKFSGLFSRGFDTRSHVRIQWSSCVPNLTVILLFASRVFATWDTQCLGSHPANSRVREISSISDTCPPQMDGSCPLATSPLRDLEYPILGFSTCELPSSRDHRSLPPVLLRWMALSLLATSPLRDLEYPILGFSTCELPSSRDHRSLPPVLLRWTALIL
jgi:hypothetical protein